MSRSFVSLAILICCAAISNAQSPAAKPALGGLDPVELANGKEIPGKADWTAGYGQYAYVFATKENKESFIKDPRRYAIQMAGACARMGPLCGAGNPARYFVFDGRAYIFASDACRETFKKNPAKHIDNPDAPPAGSKADREQGRRLMDLALKGFGGAAKVDALTNLQVSLPRSYGTGKDKVDGSLTRTISFKGQFRQDQIWGKWSGAHALNGADSFHRSGDETRPLEDTEREYLTREYYRHPLALLRARGKSGFIAIAAGKGKVGEQPVERVHVAFAGATSTLSIDPVTGRILAIAYRGRPGVGSIGAIEIAYSDFKAIDGVMLPHSVRVTWEGKSIPSLSGTYANVRVSTDLGPKFFHAK